MSTLLQQTLGAEPPWIVGVLNVTPDSFSDGGKHLHVEETLNHAEKLLADGAHIIEVGGESTAPGSKPISGEEELRRIESTVQHLATKCFVAVDTYRASTAERCLQLGAKMINDVSALRADPAMARAIAERGAFVVLMHSKEKGDKPHVTESPRVYSDVMQEITVFLKERALFARTAGISPERIILDPGMGRFLSADPETSWEVLRRFDELLHLSLPLLIGVSRKGFLGGAVEERDAVSQLVALMTFLRGADLIRTHDVKMMRHFLDVWQKLEATPRFYDNPAVNEKLN